MASIPPWSPSICDCFASGLMSEMAASKTPQRIYQIHRDHSLCCKWYLQAERARDTHTKQARLTEEQQQVRPVDWNQAIEQCIQTVLQSMQQTSSPEQAEQARVAKQAEQVRLAKRRQEAEEIRAYKAYLAQQEQWERDEQKRLAEQQEQERQAAEEARIAKAKAEAFACRRCPAKFPSNTKLHQHICDHHTKKPKPVVSNPPTPPTSPPTSPESVTSPDSLKPAPQPKTLTTPPPTPPTSISSPPPTPKRATSPKRSLLSGSAPESVPKHSGNTPTCPLTPPHTPAATRPTPPSKSAFATPTKPYLTINDLFRMFVGKPKPIGLQQHQNHQSSPRTFGTPKRGPMQMRITSYFLPAKSTKSEASTSVYDSVKQSARASPPRSPFRPSPYSPSARSLFSTTSYSSPVCWRCQGPSATYLPSNWSRSIAARAGIPVGRRGRRLFF
ncbi:hypothetical protein G7Y79_00014g036630 [Physcia stellaris]|nr:hypothetical protein G7Y79_00014g036630 [Physcia stellaris]